MSSSSLVGGVLFSGELPHLQLTLVVDESSSDGFMNTSISRRGPGGMYRWWSTTTELSVTMGLNELFQSFESCGSSSGVVYLFLLRWSTLVSLNLFTNTTTSQMFFGDPCGVYIVEVTVGGDDSEGMNNVESLVSGRNITIGMSTKVYVVLERTGDLWEVYGVKGSVGVVRTVHLEMMSLYYSLVGVVSRRRNFYGAQFIGTAVVDPKYPNSFDVVAEEEEGRVGDGSRVRFVGGHAIQLYWDFRDALNFTEGAVGGEYIWEDGDDKLTGMGKLVLEGTADIGLSFAFLIPYRAKFLSFTPNIVVARLSLVFRQPSTSSLRNMFVEPLERPVWVVMGLISLAFVGVFTLIRWLIISKRKFLQDDRDFCGDLAVVDGTLWTLACWCQRGWPLHPSGYSLRVSLLVLCLTSMVVYAGYCAQTVANFAVTRVGVSSVPEFFAKHHVNVVEGTLNDFALSFAKFYRLDSEMVSRRMEKMGEDEAVGHIGSAMRAEKALMMTPERLFALAEEQKMNPRVVCETLSVIPVEGSDILAGVFLKKRSPHLEVINFISVTLGERGLSRLYTRRFYEESAYKCVRSRMSYYKDDLGMFDVLPALLVLLLGGVGLSVGVLFLESTYHNHVVRCREVFSGRWEG